MPAYRLWPDPRTPDARFVREALDGAGWREVRREGDTWDLFWSARVPRVADFRRLGAGAFVNHFPAITTITRRDALHAAIREARRAAPRGRARAFSFVPETYVLPGEHRAFLDAVARAPRALWIEKAVADGAGRGVALVRDPAAMRPRAGRLVQRYLDRPHLLDGVKYALRCYVAVTSFDPPTAWLFDDGFVELSARPYTRERASLGDRGVHLTEPDERAAAGPSRRLTHAQYRAWLASQGRDPAPLWTALRRIAAATVLAARGPVSARAAQVLPPRAGRPFELLGFDVLVDHALKPWLLECNLSPMLSVAAPEDTEEGVAEADIKRRVVRDLLTLGGVLPGRRDDADLVGAFRRVLPADDTRDLAPR